MYLKSNKQSAKFNKNRNGILNTLPPNPVKGKSFIRQLISNNKIIIETTMIIIVGDFFTSNLFS